MNPFYPGVAARALHRCEYCHAPESVFNFPFEVDHIIPIFSSGQNEDANFALACRSCNLHKWRETDGIDPTTNQAIRLFNPRSDFWNDHFQFNRRTGILNGTTQIGRATIEQLRMNSTAQIAARKQWSKIGIF
ncbi:MAG: HNH endonuclease [Chloroflexi bacterium]|nr:MAG: HNH endonuclease [Chloroflexota bacterium]